MSNNSIRFHSTSTTEKFSFRFQNYWAQFHQLEPIIEKQWTIQPQGTRMFILTQKLKQTKQHLKERSRNFLGNNHERLSLNAQKIQIVEEKLINQPDSHRLNSWMNRLLVRREKLLVFNQKYWGNFTRKEWLINGDRNSRFFQQRATTRRKKKLLYKLKDDCGV